MEQTPADARAAPSASEPNDSHDTHMLVATRRCEMARGSFILCCPRCGERLRFSLRSSAGPEASPRALSALRETLGRPSGYGPTRYVRPRVPSGASFLCGVPSRALAGAAENGAIPRLDLCGGGSCALRWQLRPRRASRARAAGLQGT
eukprot:scaffold11162_cov113-Isochrysis_galbana.AAC.1